MINRRTFVVATTTGTVTALSGIHLGYGQLEETALPLQNASFIVSDEAATAGGSPEASPEPSELRGYILGDPDAPNTLQIYADYRCPHCRAFSQEIEPLLVEEYLQSGRMNLEFIDFTVIGVPSLDALGDDSIESVQAAEAAACAAEQDAYLAYRDWLFSGPSSTSDGDFSDKNLIAAAETLGLDVDRFAMSLGNGLYEQGIIDSVLAAIERGVQGTPAMILNGGEPFYVPQDGFGGLKTILDAELE